MENSEAIRLHVEAAKQTEHLRAIRNWVAFGGIMFIITFFILPILGFILTIAGILTLF